MAKTKKERFIEVAAARTNRVLDDLSALANCSNKNNYEYSESEAKEMFQAIENELKRVKALFLPSPYKKNTKFSFKGGK